MAYAAEVLTLIHLVIDFAFVWVDDDEYQKSKSTIFVTKFVTNFYFINIMLWSGRSQEFNLGGYFLNSNFNSYQKKKKKAQKSMYLI